jgi:uncharacterized membrane protein YhaH (DUF805 family)
MDDASPDATFLHHNPIQQPRRSDMPFQEAIKVCFAKYADFTGRATRPEYWWFMLFIVLASAGTSMISSILSALFSLATLLPSSAAASRRLHDTGRSGWWQLIVFVPVVGLVAILVLLAQEGKGYVTHPGDTN